jgi:hypothetical protein
MSERTRFPDPNDRDATFKRQQKSDEKQQFHVRPPLHIAPGGKTVAWKSRRSRAYSGMANGQVVLVTTEGLSGGPPMRTVYYVAEEDPAKAEAIIAKFMAPNEKVEAYGPLPEAAVKALKLKPGEFIHA